MKCRQDEEPQFKVANEVDLEKRSSCFQCGILLLIFQYVGTKVQIRAVYFTRVNTHSVHVKSTNKGH